MMKEKLKSVLLDMFSTLTGFMLAAIIIVCFAGITIIPWAIGIASMLGYGACS